MKFDNIIDVLYKQGCIPVNNFAGTYTFIICPMWSCYRIGHNKEKKDIIIKR